MVEWTEMKKLHSLDDADIKVERSVSRRSALGTIGIGLGAAATAILVGTAPARASDGEGRSRNCPYRDNDRGDQVRRNCGRTDND